MKFTVELLAFGKPGETREVEVPCLYEYSPREADTEILCMIFVWGQNERQPQEHTSVSAGDVIRIGEDRWLVLPAGFIKLTAETYQEYLAIPQPKRPLAVFSLAPPAPSLDPSQYKVKFVW